MQKENPNKHCQLSIVNCQFLSLSFGRLQALKKLSLSVNKGEIFGIIGPDGAGKTSLFRILTTLLLADGGTATVTGLDVVRDYKEIRRHIGYMPGRFSLYQDMTVEENLSFFASVFGTTIKENYRLIEDIYKQLEPFKKRRAGKLSGGMKQKLALCCALIHNPLVLFLDEPTTGVDPVSRKEFWVMLRRLQSQSITILVSTPYMDEAMLCDRIALMREGSFLTIDTPSRIVENFTEPIFAARSANMSHLLTTLRHLPEVKSAYAFGDIHHVVLEYSEALTSVIQQTKDANFPDIEMYPISATIEDCFMALQELKIEN